MGAQWARASRRSVCEKRTIEIERSLRLKKERKELRLLLDERIFRTKEKQLSHAHTQYSVQLHTQTESVCIVFLNGTLYWIYVKCCFDDELSYVPGGEE